MLAYTLKTLIFLYFLPASIFYGLYKYVLELRVKEVVDIKKEIIINYKAIIKTATLNLKHDEYCRKHK